MTVGVQELVIVDSFHHATSKSCSAHLVVVATCITLIRHRKILALILKESEGGVSSRDSKYQTYISMVEITHWAFPSIEWQHTDQTKV